MGSSLKVSKSGPPNRPPLPLTPTMLFEVFSVQIFRLSPEREILRFFFLSTLLISLFVKQRNPVGGAPPLSFVTPESLIFRRLA